MSSKVVVLIGLPGSGKTTLAKALHEHLGWSWVDVDEIVEREVGRSISELIRVEGEQKFRAIEASVLAQAVQSGAQVISLGGGALNHAASRALIAKETIPVQLTVELEEGAKRIVLDEEKSSSGQQAKRPLIFNDATQVSEAKAKARLAELGAQRAEHYGIARIKVSTDFGDPKRLSEVLAAETKLMQNENINIVTDPQSQIVIGTGVTENLGLRLKEYFPQTQKLVLIVDANVRQHFGKAIEQSCRDNGFHLVVCEVASGESSKSTEQLIQILETMAKEEVSRDDVVVGLGGGVVGDISGFAASVYMRGVEHVQIPSTLVAQVDSAIGGKNAVNLPQGKNLVGTFHPPKAVLSDPRLLETLPEREFLSGMAEVIKYGLIFSEEFFSWLESNVKLVRKREKTVLSRIVERSSLFKTEVVAKDLYDRLGLRAQLNFGHTVGHAIEKLSGYGEFLHGEAVAVGMMEATFIGTVLDVTPAEVLPRVALLLQAFGLPTQVPKKLLDGADEYLNALGRRSSEELRVGWLRKSEEQASPKLSERALKFRDAWQKALRADKKRGSSGLKFILLERIGVAKVLPVEVEKVVDCVAVHSLGSNESGK